MYYIGIDIGSTAAKTVVLDKAGRNRHFVLPTGWSSKETAGTIRQKLVAGGIDVGSGQTKTVATGYGRISVDFADKVITELTCHGKGGYQLLGQDCTIIDVGGQDTKAISVVNGAMSNFLMNDKCSAGTGKFLEIMANRLGVDLPELFNLAQQGTPIAISSMCTVFAESEIISHIGAGEPRENIAAGVVDSVVSKVAMLANRHGIKGECLLTGGLKQQPLFCGTPQRNPGLPGAYPQAGQVCRGIGRRLACQRKIRQLKPWPWATVWACPRF